MKASFDFNAKANALMNEVRASAKAEFQDFAIKLLNDAGITTTKEAMADSSAHHIAAISARIYKAAVDELFRNRSGWSGTNAMANNFIEACIYDVCEDIIRNTEGFILSVAIGLSRSDRAAA